MSDGARLVSCHCVIDWMPLQAFYDKASTRVSPVFQSKPLLLAWSMASSVEMWEGQCPFSSHCDGHSGFLHMSDMVGLLETCEDLAVGA